MITASALALIVTAAPAPASSGLDPVLAEDWVGAICKRWATDPANPWALAHGVEVLGTDLRTTDGRLAVDVMVSDFVTRREEGKDVFWDFPPFVGRLPVDPHRNHTIATLLRSGVPLLRRFDTPRGPVTLGELAESLKRTFVFQPGDDFYKEHPWTLDALEAVTSESSPTWTNALGATVDLSRVLDATVDYLASQHRFLDDARKAGLKSVPKRKQLIWSHPCGGLHLVQAAFGWADQPGFKKRHLADAEWEAEVLFYRLDAESRLYAEALEAAPQYRLQIEAQKLKFYGHWLETMMRLKRLGLYKDGPERKAAVARARVGVSTAVLGLKQERAAERMAEFRQSSLQMHLDLVGDSCHALAGLRESR